MRSATPATIPGLKREASEPAPLSTIPSGERPLKERSWNVLSRSVSNLTAEDSKAQKKAKMEADLKDAISALKKPNRQLAGKAIVEEAEKRIGSSSSPRPRSKYSCGLGRLQTTEILTLKQNRRTPLVSTLEIGHRPKFRSRLPRPTIASKTLCRQQISEVMGVSTFLRQGVNWKRFRRAPSSRLQHLEMA
jgi:hypothetical protein